MTAAVTINLPWPPTETGANASGQGKWRRKAGAAKGYKADCAWLLKAANVQPVPFKAIIVSVTFNQPKSVPRFDLDNMLGRIKQGLDAVAEAIGVDDAKWLEMRLLRGPKGGEGSVTIEVDPADM